MFPDANKKFVIKKISSLRSSFRRQIRRINSSKRSGVGTEDVPEPTLWSRAAVSSIEGNNLDANHRPHCQKPQGGQQTFFNAYCFSE
ncbi:unnamed protein product [Acanthoscelides obtectus]|uniref:Uncharacterized protein n=1 Tax=Acanthoscelides obtectus TaxID=200917 RepID=A0A9P0Q4C4_ACAOB|nr:unnamed protein product [Acanthoscelides obtectus]CAK1678382.1 hypothetical protein AOBTE_LOCUS31854 [Acanthoscelides obtectus]